jgi:hypothetical protein
MNNTYLATNFWLAPDQARSIENVKIVQPRISIVPAMKVYFFAMNRSRVVVPTGGCRPESLGLVILVLDIAHVWLWLRH